MKKFYLLIAALLIVVMTSMMLTEKNDSQLTISSKMGDVQPMFHKGMITIKVKEGVGKFDKQKGEVAFNIPSLDLKVNMYRVDLLEQRFKYNPNKLKKDMPDLSRIYRIEFPEEYSVTKVAREFSKDQNIEYAEPIPVVHLFVEPNDLLYDQQPYLPQIFAEQAWDIHKGENGEEEVVIAIVDSGTEWDHEDLVDNIWQNMGEDADLDGKTIEFVGGEWIFDPDDENGVDDDGNGYIDDFIGWNFYLSSNDPNPTPGTYKWWHGTKMGGYASATTNNNIGVASISWNLSIMPIQAGWFNNTLQAFNAIIYASENGADVISNSWGYRDWFSQANYEAVTYAMEQGSILVASAANENQFRINYPAAYPGVISVAALDHIDQKAGYSNFGPYITVSAPGGDGSGSNYQLLTTDVNNSYSSASGTSCSTPIVAGLLGLVKSYHPEWTSDQVITQVLGTADDIDSFNPGFENLLGSGRINAFSALKDSNVTLQQEIALDLFYSDFQDLDGNQIPEPGDTVSLSLKLRNYNYGVGADNATFTLSTEDSDITIINDTYTGDIPADDYFTLENAFEFEISEQATTHLANFKIITTADKEITWGNTILIDLLIVPTGILVFQGEGTGNTYSGDFINGFLVDQGFQVLYTSHFPFSLNGFDAVFLSYGNYGNPIIYGTPFSMEMIQTMEEYLYQGGEIYIECGSFFCFQTYFEYPNQEEIFDLFGIDEAQFLTPQNQITMLTGLDNSICQDLLFTGSTQSLSWYIDAMTPNENGVAAFEEEGYGTVAVQGEGEYGQKTFCFAYAIAHLEDNEYGTRDTLLNNIVEFFDLYDPVADFIADTTIIAEGDTVHFTDLSSNNPTSWEWEFEGGTPETSTEQNPVVVYNNTGSFDVTLIVYNEYASDTLLISDYINLNLGIDPVADFIADTTIIAEGDTVHFTDLSSNNPTSWEWEFEGGTPETSTEQNPVVVYNNTGSFDVTLIVYNEYASDTLLISDYINLNLGIDPDAGLNPGDVNIFPVPANDKLFISCKMNFQSVDILNISGQVEENQECNTNQLTINIANLPNGIYLIRLQIGNEIITKKIIKH